MLPIIQIIDHDLDQTEELKGILEAQGYEVLATVTGQAGRSRLKMGSRRTPATAMLQIACRVAEDRRRNSLVNA